MSKLEVVKNKIHTIGSIKPLLACWRLKNNKIVFTNGCFDILHLGHIDYLSKAADQGDILIIGLNSDNSVNILKGKNRPFINENARALLLAAIGFVNAVILFDEETPYNLIKQINPDVLVKGSDYKTEEIAGYDIVQAGGGEVRTIELLEGYSTTDIVDKITKG